MAKSSGFFSLRRGSTKSLTFSVLNGQQITKDRVTAVHNPRTSKQQYQRAIMATCMAAYSHMKAIEDHAFEGKRKGGMNQREFMRLNLAKLRAGLISDADANRTAVNCTAFVNFPKSNELVPNNYVISRGSLVAQTLFINWALEVENGDNTLHLSVPDPMSTVAQFFASTGLVPGSQITFLWFDQGVNSKHSIPGSGQAPGWSYIPGVFRFARFVVKKDVDLTHVFDPGTMDDQAYAISVLNYIKDDEKTTIDIGTNSILFASGSFTFNLEEGLPAFDATLTGALGIITSIEDTGERSNSEMWLYNVENNITAGNTGLTWDAVPVAWMEDIALGESDRYLEGGEI